MNFEKNAFYKIVSKKDASKVVGVNYSSMDNGANFLLWNDIGSDDQKYIFFPLDGQKYAIVPKHSGRGFAVDSGYTDNGAKVIQWKYSAAKDQQWYFLSSEPGYYFIKNQNSGKVVGLPDGHTAAGTKLFQWQQYSTAEDQKWSFSLVDRFLLPSIPSLGTLGPSPEYTSPNTNLPDETDPILTGAVLLPCILVTDNGWSLNDQMKYTPYYLLEKYQSWRLLSETTIAPDSTKKNEFKVGIKTTDQISMENTISMSVGVDAGFNIEGASASLKEEITNSLKVTESHTTEKMTEMTHTDEKHNPFKQTMYYAEYGLKSTFTLKRTDGSTVDSWTMIDPMRIHGTSYPSDEKRDILPNRG